MQLRPLPSMLGSWGAEIPIETKEEAQQLVKDVLLPDAIERLSNILPGHQSEAVIEIRGKICTYHYYFSKAVRHYGTPCPPDHKGRLCCAIAWLYFECHGQDSNIPDELPDDFHVRFRPAGGRMYYPLTRIKIDLNRD